jgi:restriction endonuclease
LKLVDDLVDFVRGCGYVLDFSDSSFTDFFAAELDIDIDIDDATYAEAGGSKGKRLRCFLQKVDDATAVRALRALWEHRALFLARTGQAEPVHNAEGRFLSLIGRLRGDSSSPFDQPPRPATDWRLLAALKEELVQVISYPPQQRGYAFETFLKRAFDAAGLVAREPFRNTGEQIDGSFVLGDETYLLEAKWHASPTSAADLHGFHGKLDQKAAWARGLFVSYNGFTPDGLSAFGSGKRLICMDGRDLHYTLERELPLKSVLERKVRRAAETGQPFVSERDLFDLQLTGRRA